MEQELGAVLADGGCRFRVWAPHVQKARVVLQSGTAWDHQDPVEAIELDRSDDGYWQGFAAGVTAGRLYRYEFDLDGECFQRLDAAARDVLHSELTRYNHASENASIVVDPSYDWTPYRTPRFENFLIYQLHCGTFAGRNDHLDKELAGFADVQHKLSYIAELGFSAIELLPVQEFAMTRSWGYNPAAFFAPESAYGSPRALRELVDQAHRHGLAMIFDVVYNHAGPGDNILWEYDGYRGPRNQGGIYFEGGRWTDWGRGPAWWKREVQEYFFQNACMYFDDYNADGLRFDVTTQIDGNHLREVLWRLRNRYPDKYLIAEHLPADPWITRVGNFDASWSAASHHEVQRALAGHNPVDKVASVLGWDGFEHAWNLVKYTMGSHDDVGDDRNGNAKDGRSKWDARHRYLVDQFGGRADWSARARCRLAWVLNIAMPGTPMLFMGGECHMGSPSVGWGYWHDTRDDNGDHRFDWAIAGDSLGMPMRRLVAAANRVRWDNPALRSDTLIVTHRDADNQVIAFKRWAGGNLLLCVANLGERSFSERDYGVATDGQSGQWTQVLCSQDAAFDGWDGAGNAFYEPWTQADGRVYVNLPKLGLVLLRLK
ncbi:MAG: alpha-amylase family glycosyl hydrolase [Gammaproteobacteria bacterium]|nr:alpha-amylase family glycosyl hydrolase [Gammaproteobacteria bacterium]